MKGCAVSHPTASSTDHESQGGYHDTGNMKRVQESYSASLLETPTSSIYSTWVDPRADGRAHKSETQ